VSFRDEFGRPRNKKTRIGKLDLITGEPIYTADYIRRNPAIQPSTITFPTNGGNIVSIDKESFEYVIDRIRVYGVFYFLRNLAQKIGLLEALKGSFPILWEEIFSLSCYLVAPDAPFTYREDWVEEDKHLDVEGMSPQRINELLLRFDANARDGFRERWSKSIGEEKFIALDIPSISSNLNHMEKNEWGYNRDDEDLPQINLRVLFGEKSRLPVYQTSYDGSLDAAATLKATISEFIGVVGDGQISFVMDKSFFSDSNVNMLYSEGIRFLVSVPFSNTLAKTIVANESRDADKIENLKFTGGAPLLGLRRTVDWGDKGERARVFAFFDRRKAAKIRERLYADIDNAKNTVALDPNNQKLINRTRKFLEITKSKAYKSALSIKVKDDIVAKELESAGWFVLMSDHLHKPRIAIDNYAMKNVVKNALNKYNTLLGLERSPTLDDKRARNKEFIAFIALILSSAIRKTMKDKKLSKSMTFTKLIIELSKLKSCAVGGYRVIRPLTELQKTIFKAFDMELPVTKPLSRV
jgi:hypothetical protein